MEKDFSKAEEALEELFDCYDHFFPESTEIKEKRLVSLLEKVKTLVPECDELTSSKQDRGRACYILGKAYSALHPPAVNAEKLLSKAVKLDPSHQSAWNAMGHFYWTKGDTDSALHCFRGALRVDRSADTLRNLSMLIRQLPDKEERESQSDRIEESIKLAKESIVLDCTDGRNVLGLALSSKFFLSSGLPSDLDKSLKAYKKAISAGEGGRNPDLHFNKGVVLKYLQRYTEAIASFDQAIKLDPLLPCKEAANDIVRFVKRLGGLVAKKGGIKPKRLKKAVAPLLQPVVLGEKDQMIPIVPTDTKQATLRDLESLLASFGDSGDATSKAHELHSGSEPCVRASGLSVPLLVLVPLVRSNEPPATFIVMDRELTTAVLSVYHLSDEAAGKIGGGPAEVLCVKEPTVKNVIFEDPATKEVGRVLSDADGSAGHSIFVRASFDSPRLISERQAAPTVVVARDA